MTNEQWNKPMPNELPRPTYAPFILAFGIMFTFWGLLTSIVMLVGGVCIIIAALCLWVREIRRGWEDSR